MEFRQVETEWEAGGLVTPTPTERRKEYPSPPFKLGLRSNCPQEMELISTAKPHVFYGRWLASN
ncbi:hypothetical protein CRV24_005091 [Beauveria bassiana]|nr:hypothetical protein CRV24_005091 [Beauveria bassiana]KAH8711734.1 hypothetical protein HC256_008548 [Beauveria bassiana]